MGNIHIAVQADNSNSKYMQGSHAFSTAKIKDFMEKKGDLLAISKENLARLRQKPIISKTI